MNQGEAMKTVFKQNTIPNKSTITNGFDKIDYFDTYRITQYTDASVEEIATEIFKLPKWASCLMTIRNFIVKIFGLKTGKEETESGKIAYFTVIYKDENEIVMGDNDKHLNFRVSILVDRRKSLLYLTTIVHFNNILGQLYFMPVKPFHKVIIKSTLKKYLQTRT